jgi:hypothetical protein
MIISGAAGFFISAIAVEVYSKYTQDDLVNTIAYRKDRFQDF